MKSYNGLYDRMIDKEEVKQSIREAAQKRTKYRKVQKYLQNIDAHADEIIAELENGTWMPPKHETVILREGAHKKERTIQKPRWDNEQIVHHLLMRQLKPIVLPRINRFCCGSIEGRSSHFLLKTVKSWVKSYHGKRFYVAELDIKKFYDTVDTELLKKMLSRRIRDKRYLSILSRVIDCASPGLPKGFYTSPFLAHVYFERADNFILKDLKPDHYARFVDNMWIFSRNKRKLRKMVETLSAFLKSELHLTLKENWQIYRFEDCNGNGRAVDLLGFVVHRNRVGLRKGILKRLRKKARKAHTLNRITIHDASSIISRMGFVSWSDTYNWYLRYVKPMISVRYCKNVVSKHQRRTLNYVENCT